MSEYPDINKLIEGKIAEVLDAKNKRLEFLAFAFLSETGLKPSECELVQQNVGNEIRFFYRKRDLEPLISQETERCARIAEFDPNTCGYCNPGGTIPDYRGRVVAEKIRSKP